MTLLRIYDMCMPVCQYNIATIVSTFSFDYYLSRVLYYLLLSCYACILFDYVYNSVQSKCDVLESSTTSVNLCMKLIVLELSSCTYIATVCWL